MATAKSISVEELTAVAKEAAESVLGDHMKRFGGEIAVGLPPHHGPVGIWLRDADLSQISAAEMFDMSAKMCEAMERVVGKVSPAALLRPHGGTMGFFPEVPIHFEKF